MTMAATPAQTGTFTCSLSFTDRSSDPMCASCVSFVLLNPPTASATPPAAIRTIAMPLTEFIVPAPLEDSSSLNDTHQHDDDGHDQENVNESAHRVGGDHPQQPQHYQDYVYSHQHVFCSLFWLTVS